MACVDAPALLRLAPATEGDQLCREACGHPYSVQLRSSLAFLASEVSHSFDT